MSPKQYEKLKDYSILVVGTLQHHTMATQSNSSNALYDDRMSRTAKSLLSLGRNALGGLGRNNRCALAEKLSASAAVTGTAAWAMLLSPPPNSREEQVVEMMTAVLFCNSRRLLL